MIKNLEIKNFKSIKHLKLDCKRVNVLIGKPNTGKSNILESVGIFSVPYKELRYFVRLESMSNLFYDQDLSEKIEIIADAVHCGIIFADGRFRGDAEANGKPIFIFNLDYYGRGELSGSPSPFKFYRFVPKDSFPRQESGFLLPPDGENLLSILLTNKPLKKLLADMFSEYGLRIVLKPQEAKIEVQKQIEDIIVSHPYHIVSDTLQRAVFHLTAIETNKDSIIIFEEPESHAFPFYTKFLAERISLSKTNQYFISTHNPYFLLSVLEKTPKDDIGVFITYLKDYQTKIRPVTEDEMSEIIDLDASVFFNLDRFIG